MGSIGRLRASSTTEPVPSVRPVLGCWVIDGWEWLFIFLNKYTVTVPVTVTVTFRIRC